MIPQNLDNLKIVLYPDPVLRKHCEPVPPEFFGERLTALACRMTELMHGRGIGVGLAAPQVGVPIRMFVCNATGLEGNDWAYVNPIFTDLTGRTIDTEGCLSIPGVNVSVARAASAAMTGHRTDGTEFTAHATGMECRVWQHECDHLDGRLIIDRISETEKITNRRALKALGFGQRRKKR